MDNESKKALYSNIKLVALVVAVLAIGSATMYNYRLNKFENAYNELEKNATQNVVSNGSETAEASGDMAAPVFYLDEYGNVVYGNNIREDGTEMTVVDFDGALDNVVSVTDDISIQTVSVANKTMNAAPVAKNTNIANVPLTEAQIKAQLQAQAQAVWQSYLTAPWKNPNFAVLAQANPDIYAWVSINGTVINYPILQNAISDEFYLNHNLDLSTGYPGCIYTQRVNTKTFKDVCTVVYGHNMRNGTMFGGLKNYTNKKYFDSHNEILVETATEKIIYDVICAASTDDTNLFVKYRMTNALGPKMLIQDLSKQKGTITVKNAADLILPTDTFLVLSTCRNINKSGRDIVIAKRRNIILMPGVTP